MATAVKNDIAAAWQTPTDQPMIRVERLPELKQKPFYEAVKRAFDFTAALIGLIVLLVPMAVIAVLVVLDSPGSPIYFQTRLGKGEKPFTICKFRTMNKDAEKDGPRWSEKNDRRVTKLGRFLRRSHLDELPQLVNILAGQMSFVGPRPERPEFYDLFDTYIDGFRQRMTVRPGLTGLAQINGGYELMPEEKIVYDLKYIKERSVTLDLKCIMRTLHTVLVKRSLD